MNKGVNESIDTILQRGTTALSADEFKTLAEMDDVLVVDTRSKEAYTYEGTVPGAWFIGVAGSFAPWVGALIKNIDQKIIFLADEGKEEEVVTRFSRVGYDHTLGYLKGGLQAWIDAGNEVDKIGTTDAETFTADLNAGNLEAPLDVRKESEFNSEHVVGLENFPLDFIHENIGNLDSEKSYTLHCASGYRSLIAASIMQANGIKNVTDVRGGFKAIKQAGANLTDYVCPTTLL